MAVVDRNSNVIANMVATPTVLNSPGAGGAGILREAAGYVANAADDSQNSVHRFCRVPSNARISSIKLMTGDASSAGAFNLGLYKTAADGGAVVDADLFASAFALTAGPFYNAELIDNAQYSVAEQVKPLWEVLGLAADPCIEYDVAATISTTYNGASVGQAIKVQYVA